VRTFRCAWWSLLLVGGCAGGETDKPALDTDLPPLDTDGVVVTPPEETDAPVVDTAESDEPEPPPRVVDCTVLPRVPAPFTTLYDFGSAEDFDFNALGQHVSVSQQSLVTRDLAGATGILATNVSSEASGTRILPDGAIVVNRVAQGSIVRVDPNGSKTVVVGDLAYPNGLEVDRDGFVYVAEQDGGRIRRIDPYTGDNWVIASGLNAPNGIIFGPDYTRLYFNSFGGGTLHVIEKITDTTYTEPVLLQSKPAGGGFDGLNVDECGNIYITEFVVGKVWRVTPDGAQVDEVAALPSSWIPNLRWGNGVGGFEEGTLYVADRDGGRLFALDIGLQGKPAVYWP
jgi:sugar lactone lactonase YvrE